MPAANVGRQGFFHQDKNQDYDRRYYHERIYRKVLLKRIQDDCVFLVLYSPAAELESQYKI